MLVAVAADHGRRRRRPAPILPALALVAIALGVARGAGPLDLLAPVVAARVVAAALVAVVAVLAALFFAVLPVAVVRVLAGDVGARALAPVVFASSGWRRSDQQAQETGRRGARGAIGQAQHAASPGARLARPTPPPGEAAAQGRRPARFDGTSGGLIRWKMTAP